MVIAEMIGLGLYVLQQLGVALGVGAQTAVLLSGDLPLPGARKAVRVALGLIIVSGILITAAHMLAGEGGVVAEPAHILKRAFLALLLI